MIKTRGHSAKGLHRPEPDRKACWLPWVLGSLLLLGGVDGQAGPVVSTDSPIGFFTNVASRLLQSQLNLSLNHIQVYPTNQYTPSVHRLLQVAANLYDATTNSSTTGYPYLPSVFRPVFAKEGGRTGLEVFISGYEEVTDTNILSQRPVDPDDLQALVGLKPHDMVCGIPLVIGAKKGFPNFNEFALYSKVQVVRKLQFRRPASGDYLPVNQTNQMFIVGISNVFGVEAWNSYSNDFPRPLQLWVWPDISVRLTNETGKVLNPAPQRYAPNIPPLNIPANTWLGYDSAAEQYSFRLPLSTNYLPLTNSTYSWTQQTFVPLTATYEQVTPAFYVPHWWLSMKTRLRFAVVDTGAGRIVDYVNLSDQSLVNLTDALTESGQCGDTYAPSGVHGSFWCTNHYPTLANENQPTYGVMNQIQVSLGDPRIAKQADWNSAVAEFPPGMDKRAAIDFFRWQFDLGPISYPSRVYYKSNTFNTPYQPLRNINLTTSWQANDPLVHYTVSDLTDLVLTNLYWDYLYLSPTANLGSVNDRYEPWGGNPMIRSASTTKYDLTLKDPVAKYYASSDDWDFPTNPLPDASWLGHVHRGTPWQTIYLKAPATSLTNWIRWTGNTQPAPDASGGAYDAVLTHPTNDWRMASLLVSLLTTNDPRQLRSANQTTVSAWCGVLDGMVVLTNIGGGLFDSLIMASNSPQALTIATALDAMRSSQRDRYFPNPGDLLATPELSTASPWLDTSTVDQMHFSLTDEAYEAIPSQLLARLRADSVGAVVQNGGTLQIQFSGIDGLAYALQVSSNLHDWASLSTNQPFGGVFRFVEFPSPGAPPRYYRSVLLP